MNQEIKEIKEDFEGNKNINVTVMTPDNDENTITISFSSIFSNLKKFFVLWLAAAVIVMFLTAGISRVMQKTSYYGDAKALIALNYEGAEEGLDPNGNELDITKIKSPSVIESALSSLDINIDKADIIRRNVNVDGVIPEDSLNEMSLYYDVFSSGSSSQLSAAQSLIDTEYSPVKYIISFDYFNTGFTLEEGKEILNAILNSYRSYFFETYSYNVALGSAATVIDYKNYDYAEAVNIFSSTLDSLSDYIKKIERTDTNTFRSSTTGYTFDDLLSNVELLKSTDLDRVSSYISINNVTKLDIKSMISYYEYKVEELTRKKNVSESTIKSISDSIEKYEKDPLILVVGNDQDGQSTDENDKSNEINKAYDDLVEKKLSAQAEISGYSKQIKYYNSIVDSFKKANTVNKDDAGTVEGYLDSLNTKLADLIGNVNKTADEYYSNVAFADAYRILVPASGTESEIVSGGTLKPIIIAEAILFIIYIGAAFILGIIESNRKKEDAEEENQKDRQK